MAAQLTTYQPALGQTFVKKIGSEIVLQIGVDKWTRPGMAEDLGLVHTQAAINLTRFAKEVDAKSVKDFAKRIAPSEVVTLARSYKRKLGVTTLYVLLCAMASKGVDVEAWYGWSDKDDKTPPFLSLKDRKALKEATNGKRTRRTKSRRQLRGANSGSHASGAGPEATTT